VGRWVAQGFHGFGSLGEQPPPAHNHRANSRFAVPTRLASQSAASAHPAVVDRGGRAAATTLP
jgi:hypothetical protein